MMPNTDYSTDIATLACAILIQLGIWLTELFANVTLPGVYEVLYDAAKLGALAVSIWASYRVGKKNKH